MAYLIIIEHLSLKYCLLDCIKVPSYPWPSLGKSHDGRTWINHSYLTCAPILTVTYVVTKHKGRGKAGVEIPQSFPIQTGGVYNLNTCVVINTLKWHIRSIVKQYIEKSDMNTNVHHVHHLNTFNQVCKLSILKLICNGCMHMQTEA